MEQKLNKHTDLLIETYLQLTSCKESSYKNSGKLLIVGNAGSAMAPEHIVDELMKGFKKARKLDEHYCNSLKNVNEVFG